MLRLRGGSRPVVLPAVAFAAVMAACDNPFALPPAALPPVETSVTLYAMTGTSLAYPSAYNLMIQEVVFTDRTSLLDFAFDIVVDSLHDTTAVLLPRGALGLYRDGGLQITRTPYDSIKYAPNSGYDEGTAVPVGLGSVVLAASRSQTCNIGYVYPFYAKIEVTALDLTARSITLQMLIDPNCGYRSLQSSSLPPTK